MAATGTGCAAPHTIEGLGVPASLVHDLVLRRALADGRTSTLVLSERLAVSPVVASTLIEILRDLRLLEVVGMEGLDYQVVLSDLGRQAARESMDTCRYLGPVPVGLAEYTSVVRSQHARLRVSRGAMRRAFADLVIGAGLLDELGPAAMSSGAMFLYGPPGTGKSSIAERLGRLHQDAVLIPRAVEVDGQVVSVLDPVAHEPVEPQPVGLDPRWVLCRRPAIITGGELTAEMLDLTLQGSGIYLAPLQMRANNGILVVDDFGRQALSPATLLNRWIVPLDRGIDYLRLDYGLTFEIPFDVKVVFSTNLALESLGDEAFFRRIENKVLIPAINDTQFDLVLERSAEKAGVVLAEGAAAHLRAASRAYGDGDLRPYLPRSVCRLAIAICEYEDRPPILDTELVDRVVRLYFANAERPDHLDEDDFTVAPPAPVVAPAPPPEPPAAAADPVWVHRDALVAF